MSVVCVGVVYMEVYSVYKKCFESCKVMLVVISCLLPLGLGSYSSDVSEALHTKLH